MGEKVLAFAQGKLQVTRLDTDGHPLDLQGRNADGRHDAGGDDQAHMGRQMLYQLAPLIVNARLFDLVVIVDDQQQRLLALTHLLQQRRQKSLGRLGLGQQGILLRT